MKNKYVPALVLIICALPAAATEIAYCDSGCGSNTIAVFTTVSADAVFTGPIAFSTDPSIGVLTGNLYTDVLTQVSLLGTQDLNVLAGVLDTTLGSGDSLTITIPATYTYVVFTLTAQSGSGTAALGGGTVTLGSSPTTVAYYNDGSPASPWTITIVPSGIDLGVNSLDAGADTPEVGTLLLIGFGLASMRWLKRVPRRWFPTPQLAS